MFCISVTGLPHYDRYDELSVLVRNDDLPSLRNPVGTSMLCISVTGLPKYDRYGDLSILVHNDDLASLLITLEDSDNLSSGIRHDSILTIFSVCLHIIPQVDQKDEHIHQV